MTNIYNLSLEKEKIVRRLQCRYGALALSRAAGEAEAAKKRGDPERTALLHCVIADLRNTLSALEANL